MPVCRVKAFKRGAFAPNLGGTVERCFIPESMGEAALFYHINN